MTNDLDLKRSDYGSRMLLVAVCSICILNFSLLALFENNFKFLVNAIVLCTFAGIIQRLLFAGRFFCQGDDKKFFRSRKVALILGTEYMEDVAEFKYFKERMGHDLFLRAVKVLIFFLLVYLVKKYFYYEILTDLSITQIFSSIMLALAFIPPFFAFPVIISSYALVASGIKIYGYESFRILMVFILIGGEIFFFSWFYRLLEEFLYYSESLNLFKKRMNHVEWIKILLKYSIIMVLFFKIIPGNILTKMTSNLLKIHSNAIIKTEALNANKINKAMELLQALEDGNLDTKSKVSKKEVDLIVDVLKEYNKDKFEQIDERVKDHSDDRNDKGETQNSNNKIDLEKISDLANQLGEIQKDSTKNNDLTEGTDEKNLLPNDLKMLKAALNDLKRVAEKLDEVSESFGTETDSSESSSTSKAASPDNTNEKDLHKFHGSVAKEKQVEKNQEQLKQVFNEGTQEELREPFEIQNSILGENISSETGDNYQETNDQQNNEKKLKDKLKLPRELFSFKYLLFIIIGLLIILIVSKTKKSVPAEKTTEKLLKNAGEIQGQIKEFKLGFSQMLGRYLENKKIDRRIIIKAYHFLLNHLSKCGFGKKEFHTPDEYSREIAKTLPAIRNEFDFITKIFCDVYYGVSFPEKNDMKEYFKKVSYCGESFIEN